MNNQSLRIKTFDIPEIMTDQLDTATVGECGVCGNLLPVGANHAYTVCKHLFCISCLLKWHKANSAATCPMCRAPLYDEAHHAEPHVEEEEEEEAEPNVEEAEQEQEEEEYQHQLDQRTIRTVQEMDFNQDERSMHNYMMQLVDANTYHYCRINPRYTYMGTTNLHTVPNRESVYSRIEVGTQNLNCHYIIELQDSSRAFRYKFGRIEDIRMVHPMFTGVSWFVFRELIERWDNDTGYMQAEWSHQTQLISVEGGQVKSLRQYVPRMRMNA